MRAPLLLLALLAPALAGCAAAPAPPQGPERMVALGDSITRGVNPSAVAPGAHEEVSWSVGDGEGDAVVSHAERLRAQGFLGEGVFSQARSGAGVEDLSAQAQSAVDKGATYVTILVGANDACAPEPTAPEVFRARFREAATRLQEGLPSGAMVYVVSLPDFSRLPALFADHPPARQAWDAFGACPALLGADRTPEDHAAFRNRLVAYNEVLAQESEEHGFAFDGGAVFSAPLEPDHVSDLDYFHPSVAGQAALAEVSWAAGPFG